MNSELGKGVIKLTLILISGLSFSAGLGETLNTPYLPPDPYLISIGTIGSIVSIILIHEWKNEKQHFRLFFYLIILSGLCFIFHFNDNLSQFSGVLWRDGIYNSTMSVFVLISTVCPQSLDIILEIICEGLSAFDF